MKHCTKKQLGALIDEELNIREKKEVLAHLSECEECSALSKKWKEFGEVLFQQSKPSEKFVQRVMSCINTIDTLEPCMEYTTPLFERISVPFWISQGVGLAFASTLIFLSWPSDKTMGKNENLAISTDIINTNEVLLSGFSDDLSLLTFSDDISEASIISIVDEI